MKSILLALALFLSSVAALNSGIFEDDGQSITQAPSVEGLNVGRRAEAFVPTPTKRVTNAERLRRGLPLLPPSKRSSPCTPFQYLRSTFWSLLTPLSKWLLGHPVSLLARGVE